MKDNEIDKYLSILKLNNCTNSLDDLKRLQRNHVINIPFENLDVIARRDINTDYENLFNKIVNNGRGGYCFELNTLYSFLLKALGFSPKPVLGRVWLRNPKKTPPRNHLAYLIQQDGETFVTDVGFGGFTTRIPLNINDLSEVHDTDGLVRIFPFDHNQFMIQRKVNDDWINQYSFENVAISDEDIFISNYYMSTNPKSHFYDDRFIGKFTEYGRIGLFNTQFSETNDSNISSKRTIAYGPEWIETVRKEFGLILDFSNIEFESIFKKN